MWRANSLRSYRFCACFALGAVIFFAAWVYAGSRREPMLEGRSVREWIRQTRSADSEGAQVFRRNGSNSVPGLVRIIRSRPTFGAWGADQLRKRSWIFSRFPQRLQRWCYETQGEARAREFDRVWAVACCGLLNEKAAAAHPTLLKACEDPNPDVRYEAVRSLLRTEVPPQKALAALTRRMLHDKAVEVRRSAAFYIGLLREQAEPAIPALRQATNDTGWGVASGAREALEKIEAALARKRAGHASADRP